MPPPPPVPPEPPPADAALAGEVPKLVAQLAKDKAYLAAWGEGKEADRAVLLTAVSDIVAFGAMHIEIVDTTRRRGLFEAVATIGKVLSRSGRLPEDFVARAKAAFERRKADTHMGLWLERENGKVPFDATAMAMWFAPNDAALVRERLRALVNGPFPYRGNDFVSSRRWLVHVGDVAVRLSKLGAFGKQECIEVHMQWTEKPMPDGRISASCDPVEEPRAAAKVAPGDTPNNLYVVAKSGAVAATREETLDRAFALVADNDRAAFDRFLRTEPGVTLLSKGESVFLVDTSGFLASKVKIRRKGDTKELWTFLEAIERP